MVRIDKIVVGTDGSESARAAVRWAVEFVGTAPVTIVLAHVVDDEWGTVGSRLIDEIGAGARALLDGDVAFARSLAPGREFTTKLLHGSPMWELSQASEDGTLVAVGTHASGLRHGRVFGSRSLQLATLAAGPVAVIPETTTAARRGIVVGVDDTDAGLLALDLAAELAGARQSDLTLVRASTIEVPPGLAEDEREDWRLRRDEEARDQLRAALNRIRDSQPLLTVTTLVVQRPPGTALGDLAHAAELLVIGDSRRPGARPGMLGSVAYDVLLNVTSPTIVVHAAEGRAERRGVVPGRGEI